MKLKGRDLATLMIMLFLGFCFWLIWNSGVGQQVSLAYPPPPTTDYSYPGPPTNTPSPTATDSGNDLNVTTTPFNTPTITNTPTPWPTPTWYPILITPLGTPVPRQGVASSLFSIFLPDRHYLGSWQWAYAPWLPTTGYPTNIEHIPQLISRPWGVASYLPTLTPLPTLPVQTVQAVASQTPHEYWLVFNECESIYQCATAPDLAAQSYGQYVEDFLTAVEGGPYAKVIIGGVNAHECGILWAINFLKSFRDIYGRDPLYIAGWHFHLYPDVTPHEWRVNGVSCAPEDNPPGAGWPFGAWDYDDKRVETVEKAWTAWQEDVWNIYSFMQEYGQPEQEIWITEMGCLNAGYHQLQQPACQSDGFMYEYVSRITGWLNSPAGRWIDRYAWYTDRNLVGMGLSYTWLYAQSAYTPTPTVPPGNPTPTPGYLYSALGNYYARVTPAPAGEFDQLFPNKRYFPFILRP